MDGNGVVVPSWVGFRNSFIAALALLGAAIASRRHSKLRGPFSIQRHQVWSQTWRKMSQRSRGLVIERGGQKTRHFLMLFPFGRCRVQCHDWWLIPKCLKWLVVSLQLGLVMIYPDWWTLRWWASNLNRKMWSEGKSNCVYVYSVCIYYIMYISRYIYIYIYTHTCRCARAYTCRDAYMHRNILTCTHTDNYTYTHNYTYIINTYTVFLPEMAMERGERERASERENTYIIVYNIHIYIYIEDCAIVWHTRTSTYTF